MILNKIEFFLMNNPVRRFIQEKREIKELRRLSSLGKNKVILEVGCGSGFGTTLIKKYFRPKSIDAIDLDHRMIALAREQVHDPSISFHVGSATQLPYENNHFDAIIDFGIIHHIPNWRKSLDELYRVLRPGGELILEDLSRDTFETMPGKLYKLILDHPYSHMYRQTEFISHLETVGFTVKVHKTYRPFHLLYYFVVVAQKKMR